MPRPGGVANGWAPSRLLDTYHRERHPVAARMLSYVTAQETLMLGGREIEPLRAVLAELTRLERVRSHLARVLSGLDDRYGPADSPLVGRRLPSVRMRDRNGSVVAAGLPTGTEPFIVRLSAPADGDAEAVALPGGFRMRTVYAVPDGAGSFPGVNAILVRPDGYIAWAGDNDAELKAAIEQWLGV